MPVLDAKIHLDPGALAAQMAIDVRAGLTADPKTLPPKYFYDARGSELFDEITRLEEYYPTRAERAILDRHVVDIARACAAETLVELGSGTSEKTQLLIGALTEAGTLRRFVPESARPPSALRSAAGSSPRCRCRARPACRRPRPRAISRRARRGSRARPGSGSTPATG